MARSTQSMRKGDRAIMYLPDTHEEVDGEVVDIQPATPGHVHYVICGNEPQSSISHRLSDEVEEAITNGSKIDPTV